MDRGHVFELVSLFPVSGYGDGTSALRRRRGNGRASYGNFDRRSTRHEHSRHGLLSSHFPKDDSNAIKDFYEDRRVR